MGEFRSNFQTVEQKEMSLEEMKYDSNLENDRSYRRQRLVWEVNL